PMEYQAMLDAQNNPLNMTSVDDFAGFPTNTSPPISSGGSLFDTPQNLPKKNPDVIDGELPTFGNGGTTATNPTPGRRKGNGGRVTTPSKTPKPDGVPDEDDTAVTTTPSPSPSPTATVDPTGSVESFDINKRPFVDLGLKVNEYLDKKEFKLDSAFVVNATGKLNKDGKLDTKSIKWGQVASQDQKMIEIVKDAISAINDSGYLQYLKDISGKDFSLMLQQDEANITAVVQSEMESDLRAKSASSNLGILMAAAKYRKSGQDADQNDKDDLLLLNNAKVETDGKKLIIKFLVPKAIAIPMIERKLAEQKAQPKPQNSTGAVKPGNNAANQ
ncbi:MAG: hypothetical protein ABL959_16875, partial [Pyrinomonadaceae bacterium]